MVATPWDNGYGLMNPWGNAWGMSPQAVADKVVREQVAPAMGVNVDGSGSDITVSPEARNTGPQTPADKFSTGLALDSVKGYAKEQLGQSALGIMGATAAGFAPTVGQALGYTASNFANPSGLAGLMGGTVANQMGFSKPQGVVGRVTQYGLNPLATMGLSMVNPALGVAYGLLSPFVADMIGDMTNTRRDEKYKDNMEDTHGTFGGRAVSKDMTGFADRHGFDGMTGAYGAQGYSPADAARGMSNKDATSMARGQSPMGYTGTYGGWGAVGGPKGGVDAANRGFGYGDPSYGRSMGGFAGLGIGNPSSYGGRNSSDGGGSSSGGRSGEGDQSGAGQGGWGR